MALINCPECQKEVSDSAAACPFCGYGVEAHFNKSTKAEEDYKKRKKKFLKIVAFTLAVLVVLCVLDILRRPNISMDDFDTSNGSFETLLFLGIPTVSEGSERVYIDCGIKFYGIPVEKALYDVSKGRYFLGFEDEYVERVNRALGKYCTYAGRVSSSELKYTYDDLEISAYYHSIAGCYILIE